MNQIELVAHPIRMRIILTLANRVLTTQQVADLLPDVAQTTLYRHINLLLEGGILTIVRESKVRGTTERALTLVSGAGRIDMETSTRLSADQHEQLFTTFVALLLADFQRAQSGRLPEMPPAFYTQQRLYLSPAELLALNQHLDALLAPYHDPSRPSAAGQVQPWLFTGIAMPDTNLPPPTEE